MTFKREKFKRLVHYIIWKAGKRDWFGAVKLNKVLWFSDTEAFAHTGEPITGAKYIPGEIWACPKGLSASPLRARTRGHYSRLARGQGGKGRRECRA